MFFRRRSEPRPDGVRFRRGRSARPDVRRIFGDTASGSSTRTCAGHVQTMPKRRNEMCRLPGAARAQFYCGPAGCQHDDFDPAHERSWSITGAL